MTELFAQPYDISAQGFYFQTAEEYQEKSAKTKNDFGFSPSRNTKSSSSTARASTPNCSRLWASINATSRSFWKPVTHGTTSRSKKSSSPWASAATAST